MSRSVWLVYIEGNYSEGRTETYVYAVFGDREMAESCAKEIKPNKRFDGTWVIEAWASDEYVVREAKP